MSFDPYLGYDAKQARDTYLMEQRVAFTVKDPSAQLDLKSFIAHVHALPPKLILRQAVMPWLKDGDAFYIRDMPDTPTGGRADWLIVARFTRYGTPVDLRKKPTKLWTRHTLGAVEAARDRRNHR